MSKKKKNKALIPLYPVIKEKILNYDKAELDRLMLACIEKCSNVFEHVLVNNKLHILTHYGFVALNADVITVFCETYEKLMFAEQMIQELPFSTSSYRDYFKKWIFISIEKEIRKSIDSKTRKIFKHDINDLLSVQTHTIRQCVRELRSRYPLHKAVELIIQNRGYKNIYRNLIDTADAFSEFHRNIIADIDTPYPDTFPEARNMKRHFVLHIGPTNSGKTYNALQALKEAQNGIYLAPLRLLAYEIFDQLNKEGVLCDMLTGEEEISIPFSTHTSCTIEMLDYSKEYDIAVIDEAQMIADRQRGSSCTNAIVGIKAKEIHVCAAPYAEDILTRIISECNDSFEIQKSERNTEIFWRKTKRFDLKLNVQDGDALIVFSRNDVHAVSSELESYGRECSIIYGNLPYNIRHEEARKFNIGETKIVVATDAIGMGLNMPIKRVVFLRTDKFDGVTRRNLKPEEIQQIAGRAGRFGIYDNGFVTSVSNFKYMKKLYESEVPQITSAVIAFPEKFTELGLDLSLLLRRWADMVEKQGYIKCDLSDQIKLCRVLEEKTKDKKLIYSLITIPFDQNLRLVMNAWKTISGMVISGETISYSLFLPEVDSADDMQTLEEYYKLCDLLYSFQRKFPTTREEKKSILIKKQQISERIEELIKEKALESRTCRLCGRALSWNSEHRMCEECYALSHN